jgi:NTE family protein
VSSDVTLREYLQQGPFSLALSAGFFGFFAHAGVLSVLEEHAYLPQRISGASAGALIGGLWAAGVDAEHIRVRLVTLSRQDFWDPSFGFGLLRGRLFLRLLDELLPVASFEGCRVRLALSVYNVTRARGEVRQSGQLGPAIVASCSLPGLFQPRRLDQSWFLDGGITDRAGLLGMPAGERVLQHDLLSRSAWGKLAQRRERNARVRATAAEPSESARSLRLVIQGLPRVHPFDLLAGKQAFRHAREATARALDRPAVDGLILAG